MKSKNKMPTQINKKDYRVFEWQYNKIMPQLIERGFQPLTTADTMKRRIGTIKKEEEKDFWFDNDFNTTDAIAYSTSGKILVIINSDLLKQITQEQELWNGSLPLQEEQYQELAKNNQEFTRKHLKKAGINKRLTKKEVLNHPLWQALAGNQILLEKYSEIIFQDLTNRNMAMAFNIREYKEDKHTLSSIILYSCTSQTSGVEEWDIDDEALLIGIPLKDNARRKLKKLYLKKKISEAIDDLLCSDYERYLLKTLEKNLIKTIEKY